MENNEQNIIQQSTTPEVAPVVIPPVETGHKFVHAKISISILALVIIATVLLVFALVQKTNTNTPIKQPAVNPRAYLQSDLSFSTPLIASAGAYNTNIQINTGNNKVTGVDIRLSYDPTILTHLDIQPGSFFTNPVVLLKKIDSTKGTITYTIAINPNTKFVTGKGTVATISFVPATTKISTPIDFQTGTEISAVGFPSSVLNAASDLIFTTK
jgi:hypothetical protein